eukprot:331280-Alexandrium_andersonii.AAC.1
MATHEVDLPPSASRSPSPGRPEHHSSAESAAGIDRSGSHHGHESAGGERPPPRGPPAGDGRQGLLA